MLIAGGIDNADTTTYCRDLDHDTGIDLFDELRR